MSFCRHARNDVKVKMNQVKIAKEFHWEMAHRLAYHQGGCQNLHGHSYRLHVEIEGTPMENGMVMDYADLKLMVEPLVKELDHGFLCSQDDDVMKKFLANTSFKVVYVDFFTTAENIATYFGHRIKEKLKAFTNVSSFKVRISETRSTYAEIRIPLK
jgi:6-pyruvoyltetrahydropterin/6-carboxytetrahydropterin synthase